MILFIFLLLPCLVQAGQIPPPTAPAPHQDAPDATICQFRTFKEVGSEAEFSRKRCFRIPGSYAPSATPSVSPTVRPTTASPSYSMQPTPSRDFLCPSFSVSGTAYASNPNADFGCKITACPGDRVRASTLSADGGSCNSKFILCALIDLSSQ